MNKALSFTWKTRNIFVKLSSVVAAGDNMMHRAGDQRQGRTCALVVNGLDLEDLSFEETTKVPVRKRLWVYEYRPFFWNDVSGINSSEKKNMQPLLVKVIRESAHCCRSDKAGSFHTVRARNKVHRYDEPWQSINRQFGLRRGVRPKRQEVFEKILYKSMSKTILVTLLGNWNRFIRRRREQSIRFISPLKGRLWCSC